MRNRKISVAIYFIENVWKHGGNRKYWFVKGVEDDCVMDGMEDWNSF